MTPWVSRPQTRNFWQQFIVSGPDQVTILIRSLWQVRLLIHDCWTSPEHWEHTAKQVVGPIVPR